MTITLKCKDGETREVSSAFYRTENEDYDGRFISVLKINYNKRLNRDKKECADDVNCVRGIPSTAQC